MASAPPLVSQLLFLFTRRCSVFVFYERGRSADPGSGPGSSPDHSGSCGLCQEVLIRSCSAGWVLLVFCGNVFVCPVSKISHEPLGGF